MVRRARQRLRSPSPATVIAVIAVVLAAGGGGAYALTGANTVFSDDIVNRQVGSQDLNGPITVNGEQVQMGPSGSESDVGASTATCPAGAKVTGGGWDGLSRPPIDASVAYNRPADARTWVVIMANWAPIRSDFRAVARCVPRTDPPNARAAPPAAASPPTELLERAKRAKARADR